MICASKFYVTITYDIIKKMSLCESLISVNTDYRSFFRKVIQRICQKSRKENSSSIFIEVRLTALLTSMTSITPLKCRILLIKCRIVTMKCRIL